jgi:hypothetical protein
MNPFFAALIAVGYLAVVFLVFVLKGTSDPAEDSRKTG